MRNSRKSIIDGYNERHLAQLIRRNMMSKTHRLKTKYTRKTKHKSHESLEITD